MILALRAVTACVGVGRFDRREQACEIKAVGFPMLDRGVGFEAVDAADHFVDCAEAKPGHQFARLFGDHEQVVDDMLGLASKLFAQLGVLCRNADGASVEMTLAHHDAAERDQRRCRKTKLFGTKHRSHHDVAACASVRHRFAARPGYAGRSAPTSDVFRPCPTPTAARRV